MTVEFTLHPIEKAILHALRKRSATECLSMSQVAQESNLSLDQARRGIEWLKAKQLVDVKETESVSLSLGKDGITAVKLGLPERRLVNFVKAAGGIVKISAVSKSLADEFQIALGQAKKQGWVKVSGNTLTLSGETTSPEEAILEKVSKAGNLLQSDLNNSELDSVNALRRRLEGYLEQSRVKEMEISLSEKGRTAAFQEHAEEIDGITPEVLRTGDWKHRRLRPLDVTSPAPHVYGGRRHPMRMFMDEVREAFVSLGFEEIIGSITQSSFWNFDALFIPQQHSAREMQDTFYVSKVRANLGAFEKDVEAVKTVHENGGETGSQGWQYSWRREEAERVVLRTHTTAVTISYLAKHKPSEARLFSVGRVFRNEKANYKHNPEFYQIEGIMVGPKLNLRNLIFVLSKFYSKLGFDEIKFWPTYFPYTEPSLQTMIIHKQTNKWMELGGSGVFRPEVTLPLGVKNPVLAWGLGLDRLVMLRYNVSDVRELYGANQDWLRHQSVL